MTDDQLRAAIRSAIEGVRKEAPPLNFKLVHERAIAHRLAVHMEPHLGQEWNVDCEYDRDGEVAKALMGISDSQKKTDKILPDIIVHHRGGKGHAHNLLVVELKKDAAEARYDQRKLELLTHPEGYFQYQFGLYINIDSGKFTRIWYKDSRKSRVGADRLSGS
jgi:hypothetical protein